RAMVAAGEFRSDLYFRLDVFPIELPPLRDRASDIPALAVHLLAASAARHRLAAPTLLPDALELLSEQPWPGNVRELANVLERAAILSDSDRLDASTLGPLLSSALSDRESEDDRSRLRAALSESDGDKQRAAVALGISYRTLQRRVKEFDLEGFPRFRE
ncbi:MAG: helix-turn-helix domain-containing protein, partial [Pseudolysinimonas sp.]